MLIICNYYARSQLQILQYIKLILVCNMYDYKVDNGLNNKAL